MNAANFVGSHWVLYWAPWWLVMPILWFFCWGILRLGRNIFEGFGYNISFSSEYGDLCIISSIGIAISVLKQTGQVPHLFASPIYHLWCFGLALSVAVIWQWLNRSSWKKVMIMDTYHNTVIVPCFIYLLSTMFPVIFSSGGVLEKVFAIIFMSMWLTLVIFDAKTGRLNQRGWLMTHGFERIIK